MFEVLATSPILLRRVQSIRTVYSTLLIDKSKGQRHHTIAHLDEWESGATTAIIMAESTSSPAASKSDDGHTTLQWGIMLLVLGSSAGLTLYTKKTGSMLQGLKKMEETQLRKHPPRIGPQTKQEYEKLRPRIDKDEFF